MPAPKGNNNAEKWTEKEAKKLVDRVYKYVQDTPDCVFIGEPLAELGYYRTLWNYLETKFDFDTIKNITAILESRLVKLGISGGSNATMTIFTLKNNYGWRDEKSIEHKGELPKLQVEVVKNESK